MEKYIVQIGYENNGDFKRQGYGVLIGRKIFTAGHVVDGVRMGFKNYWALIEGCEQPVLLCLRNNIFCCFDRDNKDPKHTDLAIFDLDADSFPFLEKLPTLPVDINSPLTKSCAEPIVGEELMVVNRDKTVKCRVTDVCATCEYVERDARGIVYGSGKYDWTTCFTTTSEGQLEHGDSGSPILRGSEVVGILIMGIEPEKRQRYADFVEVDDNAVFMKMSEVSETES